MFALTSCFWVSVAVSVTVKVAWDKQPAHTVDYRELSYAWDIYALHPLKFPGQLDLKSASLRLLTKQLGPAVLRVSGTSAENAQFGGGPNIPLPPAVSKHRQSGGGSAPFRFTAQDFSTLAQFAESIGADLVLGLNQLTRVWPRDKSPKGNVCDSLVNDDCPWNHANAQAWMEYNVENHIKIYGYELGNEPGCYMTSAKPDKSVGLTPADVAHDFRALKKLIAHVYGDRKSGYVPLVMGPDVGGCKHGDLNAAIFATKGGVPVDVLTFHHYVIGGAVTHGDPNNVNVSAMIHAALSSASHDAIESFASTWRAHASTAALWIGEGGTSCANYAVTKIYANIFNAFNILRQGGLLGVSVFVKQALPSFYQKCKRSEPCDYQPLAFYWFALLWKKIMANSRDVYEATTSAPKVLAVARGLAVAALNLRQSDEVLAVRGWTGKQCHVYTLSPDAATGGTGGVRAKVNGKVLEPDRDGKLPMLVPTEVLCDDIPLPSMSVVFISLHADIILPSVSVQ